MKPYTIKQLNQINQKFYLQEAASFDKTRQNSQPGWEMLWNLVKDKLPRNIRILDVGCGNGRFGQFLSGVNNTVEYVGIDNNRYLLDQAKQNLKGKVKAELIKQDVILNDLKVYGQFDLVVAFGVWHHIPGRIFRQKWVEKLGEWVKPNGYLGLSIWQFGKDDRFIKRRAEKQIPNLETNDFLLKWQDSDHLRYCHATNKAEVRDLVEKISLKLVDNFEADGKSGRLGRYLLWMKQ